jgi:hypothetical protein
MSLPHPCQRERLPRRSCSRGTAQFLGIRVKNLQLFVITCGIPVIMGFHTAVYSEIPRNPSGLPPVATGSESVKKVFDVKQVRPLQPASFQPLRRYFSPTQQKHIDQFLRVLGELIAMRNRVADQVGIKQEWWWPADIGADVHAIMKNDPLTDRASVPDEVTISDPTLLGRKLEIKVEDRYNEIARDGTDMGGTKCSRVTLIPEDGRWVIDNVVFTVRQYGKTEVASLAQILATDTKQLRSAWQKMVNRKFEVRTPQPVSEY